MKDLNELKIKSTGTTIISCPYNNGVVIATDTQASDVQTFASYYVPNKTDPYLFLDVEPGVEIALSGAGYSNATSTVATLALRTLKNSLRRYNVNLKDFKNPKEFMQFFNQFFGVHFYQKMNPLQYQISQRSGWLITVKNPNFVFTFETSFEGGSCFNTSNLPHRKGEVSSLCGIGSGHRYVLGAALASNLQKQFETRTLDQVVSWIKKTFAQTISKDIGSNVKHGLMLTIVDKDRRIEVLEA